MDEMRIFVSHSHKDSAFCRALVKALRAADADVWYDEHNLGAERLLDAINRELESRPVFIPILSKDAFASSWVRDECQWAYTLYKRTPNRIIFPITADQIDEADFNSWLFLEGFARIEAPGFKPYPTQEAIDKTLVRLGLPIQGDGEDAVVRRDKELADELLSRGKVLSIHGNDRSALPFLECASELAPDNFEIWIVLGWCYGDLRMRRKCKEAFAKAQKVAPEREWEVLFARGHTENNAGWWEDSLKTWDQLIAIEPDMAHAWLAKGMVLGNMATTRNDPHAHEQAIEMLDKAMSLESIVTTDMRVALGLKAKALGSLGRPEYAARMRKIATDLRKHEDHRS